MKARLWLVIAAVALWAAVVIATRPDPARATEILLTAGELAQIEHQARALCARTPAPGYVSLPDGVLVCTSEPRRPRSQITALFPAHTPKELMP